MLALDVAVYATILLHASCVLHENCAGGDCRIVNSSSIVQTRVQMSKRSGAVGTAKMESSCTRAEDFAGYSFQVTQRSTLHGQDDYRYEIKIGGDIYQTIVRSGTRIKVGAHHSYNGLTEYFRNGDSCGGSVRRQADVTYTVGSQLTLLQASEPSLCNYAFRIQLPFVSCPCTAPTVSNQAAAGACFEGNLITAGLSCTTRCKTGYQPSVGSLTCNSGTLVPSTFTCQPMPCQAPTVQNQPAGSACAEGASIGHGSICTTRCAAGYRPSIPQLSCSTATLNPATFRCDAVNCPAHSSGANVPSTCSCNQGYSGSIVPSTQPPNYHLGSCSADGCTVGANGEACQNNGAPTGTTGSCGCQCQPGFSGANCEIADPCSKGANDLPCQNNGTATGTTGSCGCACPQFTSGDHCENLDSDSCEKNLEAPCHPTRYPCYSFRRATCEEGRCVCGPQDCALKTDWNSPVNRPAICAPPGTPPSAPEFKPTSMEFFASENPVARSSSSIKEEDANSR